MDQNTSATPDRPAPGRKSPAGGSPPHTVLVAEDDPDVRLMMRTLLEARGYRVVESPDGPETLRAAEVERPDIILMDLQLPRLNGFAVARFVRQTDSLRHVPIVVISGHDPAKHLKLALAAGCNGYLLKPIDFGRLRALLEELLRAGGAIPRQTTQEALA